VIELVGFVAVVAVVLVVGIRLGMLVAPRFDRWTEHDEEESRDDGPG
jgi:Ni/Fe-hydrogenase subunit HybB-like protein